MNLLKNLNKIFKGEIFICPKTKPSIELEDEIWKFLHPAKKINPFDLEKKLSQNKFYELSLDLKKQISNSKKIHSIIGKILLSFGINLSEIYFDLPRLRIIPTYLHNLEQSKPAFAIHRDTWYSNPEHQINFWIPLQNIDEKNSFSIYLDYFQKKVLNNSNEFDYDKLKLSGGFGTRPENRIFPELKEKIVSTEKFIPKLNQNEILIFSSQHLHGTNPNLSYRTRFSLDFRIYFKKKFCILKNLDNYSKGSIEVDYLEF